MRFSPTTSSARPFLVISLLYFYLATSISAFVLSAREKPTLPLPAELIYEFPPVNRLENIAVRRNGQILTTVLSAPIVYQVDPNKKRDPILLYTFPASLITGIAELQPDVFYIVAGTSTPGAPNSYAVWKLDLRPFSISRGTPVQVTKVANITDARLLNGLAVLDHRKGLLLIADSALGRIWQLNVYTQEVTIFFEDGLVKAPSGSVVPFGVNGIKVRNGAVYFSNSARNIIARVDLNRDGTAKGPSVVVVEGFNGVDDFAIGPNGAFFAAVNGANTLAYAPATGGEPTTLANITANPNAVAFGRRPEDAKSVYISSAGGPFGAPPSPSNPARGRIWKVDVTAFLDPYTQKGGY